MKLINLREAEITDRFGLARILINATNGAFKGKVPEHCLTSLGITESATNWRRSLEQDMQDRHLFVAEVESFDLVGFILAGTRSGKLTESTGESQSIAMYSAEVVSLQIEPAWQRDGLGRMLMQHVASVLMNEGHRNLLVRVLVDNPNVAFYEKLGAKLIGSRDYDWEGYQTREFIYGWEDLIKLVQT
jgi:ribosomal protein S18 acetylase RimI-like enzyme